MIVFQSAEELLKTKKQEVIDCFVEFFGEKYRHVIEKRMADTSFVFADRENFNKTDYFDKYVEPMLKDEIGSFYKQAMQRLRLEPKEVPNITIEMLHDLEKWSWRGFFNRSINTISHADYKKVAKFLCVFLSMEENKKNFDKIYQALNDGTQRQVIKECINEIRSVYDIYKQKISVLLDIKQHAFSNFGDEQTGEVIKIEQEYCQNYSEAIANHLAKVFGGKPSEKIQKRVTREMANFFLMNKEFISYYNFDVFESILKECEKVYKVPKSERHKTIEDFIFDEKFIKKFSTQEIRDNIRDIYQKRCAMLGNEKGDNHEIDKFFEENKIPVDNELVYTLYNGIFSSDVMAALHSYYNGELKNLCRLSSSQQVNECLFHELTHICDTANVSNKNETCLIKSGLKYKGDGTMLNEIVTDIIACKVMAAARKKGIEISETPFENGLYLVALPLIEPLDKTCHEALVDCLMSDNYDAILDIFGKDEYAELCMAIDEFYYPLIGDQIMQERINKQIKAVTGYSVFSPTHGDQEKINASVAQIIKNRRKLFEQLRTGEIQPEDFQIDAAEFLKNASRVEKAVEKIQNNVKQKDNSQEKI